MRLFAVPSSEPLLFSLPSRAPIQGILGVRILLEIMEGITPGTRYYWRGEKKSKINTSSPKFLRYSALSSLSSLSDFGSSRKFRRTAGMLSSPKCFVNSLRSGWSSPEERSRWCRAISCRLVFGVISVNWLDILMQVKAAVEKKYGYNGSLQVENPCDSAIMML